MLPRREIIMKKRNPSNNYEPQNVQYQIGGVVKPTVMELFKNFLEKHKDFSQKIRNKMDELLLELKGVNDFIAAYQIINRFITKNTNELITSKLKQFIIYLAISLPNTTRVVTQLPNR